MQAIKTTFLGPTNTKGARIKAECAAKTITVGYQYEYDAEGNHSFAAMQLCRQLGWNRDRPEFRLHTGQLKNGDYVHVMQFGPD